MCASRLRLDRLTVGLALWSAACFSGGLVSVSLAQACDLSGSRAFVLDLGTVGDTDTNGAIFLTEGSGLSDRVNSNGRTYRLLNANGTLSFRAVTPAVCSNGVSSNGVPYENAVIAITYKDVINGENCPGGGSWSDCRPQLLTKLDYGENPPIEWQPLVDALGGAHDMDWKTTLIFIEANPWQTLRSLDGYFEFELDYPEQGSADTVLALPIDKITLWFPDATTFDACREADRQARGLERRNYTESNSSWANTNGYVVYARNYLEKIYPNTIPASSEVIDSLTTFEIAGEAEPVTFAIYAFQNLENVQVSASVLWKGEDQIGIENVRIQTVECADKRWQWSFDKYYGVQPWYLDDNRLVDVPAEASQQYWVTIQVPDSAEPGVYEGQITITADGVQATNVALILRVFNVMLQGPDAIPSLCHSPYWPDRCFAAKRITAVRDMADHDLNPIVYVRALIGVDTQSSPPTYNIDYQGLDDELRMLSTNGILPTAPRVGIQDNVGAVWEALCDPQLVPFVDVCGAFDTLYAGVLQAYRDKFSSYGATDPVVSFCDEPGANAELRAPCNYRNRLAQPTWTTGVTYYPNCDVPLAGYHFSFEDSTPPAAPAVPEWLATDSALEAYWTFTSNGYDGSDESVHGNDGFLFDGAYTTNGELVLPSTAAYMNVPDPNTVSFSDQATIYFWMRPTLCPEEYACHPIEKREGPVGSNYIFYFFGDYYDAYRANQGRVKFYANVGESAAWQEVSGSTVLDCSTNAMNRWYNVFWVYDSISGGTLYVNGDAFPGTATGLLATNNYPLKVGHFFGRMDDVLMLDRALNAEEIAEAIVAVNTNGYNQEQDVTFSWSVPSGANPPTTFTFLLNDTLTGEPALETVKSLTVKSNGVDTVVWQETHFEPGHQLVRVELTEYAQPYTLEFRIRNGHARKEELDLYFVEDYWRNSSGTPEGVSSSDHWQYTETSDPSGSLGPMDPYLDERFYPLEYASAEQMSLTAASGDRYSYYTTYPATQDVILNNRFLNGVYASAVGAKHVSVYAYGDWGPQPWDDNEPMSAVLRDSEVAQRGYGGYQLVLPSWEDRMYDTLILESLREGIEDSRIIATLKKAMADHPAALATAAAQGYLEDIFGRLDPQYAPRYMHTAALDPIEQYADRSAEVLEDLADDPEGFDVFNDIRFRMIQYIRVLSDDAEDCNSNALPDEDDIAAGTSGDLNGNNTPDECDDCNLNNVRDGSDITFGTSADCNNDGVPDECDLAAGTSADCDANEVPDECEADCNQNGVHDECDLVAGTSTDCNGNSLPDECDLSFGTSTDCNTNGIPDECDLAAGTSADADTNGLPDECPLILDSWVSELTHGTAGDFDIGLSQAGADGKPLGSTQILSRNCEPRSRGTAVGYRLRCTFDRAVNVPAGSVTAVGVTYPAPKVATITNPTGNTWEFAFTGANALTDWDKYTITVGTAVAASASGYTLVGDRDVVLYLLQGNVTSADDPDGYLQVNSTDVSAVRSHFSESANSTNFWFDVFNIPANGAINSGDLSMTNGKLGHQLLWP
jgi:hypothetical protein